MTKRQSLKGKGADIYTPKGPEVQEAPVQQPADEMPEQPTINTVEQQTGKATFYLPSTLLDLLDMAWMERRRVNRHVRKSDIVREALEAHLRGNQ